MDDVGSEEPQGPVEHLADAGLKAIEQATKDAGGELQFAAVFVYAEGLGKPDAASAGWGFEDSRELLAFLITQAQGLAKAHGISMGLMSLDEPIGEG